MKTIILLLLIFFVLTFDIFPQTPVYYNNFPIELDVSRSPFLKVSVPLITDLDKDGQKEIITSGTDYAGVLNPPVMLYVVKSDASFYPNFPKGFNELIFDIASGDIDGNGFLDIALRMMNSIDVIDKLGNHLDGFPLSYYDGTSNPFKFISLYDLDNDGKLEIIVSKTGEVSVFNFDGTIRSGWPIQIPGTSKYNPAIGDIDNDGFAEMIFTSFRESGDSGMVNIFKHNGEVFSNVWPKYFDINYFSWSSSPSLYIDNNNSDSTFFTIVIDENGGSDYENHRFVKYNIYGKVLAEKNYGSYMDYGTLVMGDLDRNGINDFVTGTQFGITLSGFDNVLNRISGWPNFGVGEHYATAVIGKVATGNDLNIIINRWSADDGFGYIYGYSKDGNYLPWAPLRPVGLVKAISAADLNNDGSVELIATSTRTGYEFYLHAWTVPGISYKNEDFPWPQYGHDRYRTNQYGFIPPDEPVGILPTSTIVPEKFSLNQNFPNPFNPATTIKFDIRTSAFTKLNVFDALGREIETLVNEKLSPGSYSLVFDGSKFTSGVYFYRLTSENFTETKRMLMIR